MPWTEGPKCNLVKTGQAVSEKRTFKDYKILYMYKAHRQGQINQEDKILIVPKRVCYFEHTFQPAVFKSFSENDFTTSIGMQI